jgi:LacI family transcriptional regulator
MPTIQDVAKRAGVAAITASRVVNSSGYASQDVRERVLQAAAELGYVPNTLARSLRSRRSDTLALVLTDITNPFFTTVARGVEDAASDAGYMVVFCNTDESEDEERKYINVLLQKRVDGILLVPARDGLQSLRAAREQNIPIVVLDRRLPEREASDPDDRADGRADVVRCDSRGGAYQLTRLLLDLGHRRIVLLNGPGAVSTAADRAAGFQDALSAAGLGASGSVLAGSFTQASGAEMVRQALRRDPPPTALIAGNNFIAIGALNALRELGLRVPADVALAGFDDLPPALVTFPFLTVASQPAYAMGQAATRLLLARLGGDSGDFREIVLPVELIVRASSGEALRMPPGL